MKVMNTSAGEVLVGRDPNGSFLELKTVGEGVADRRSGVLLTQNEARRLAALILFEAGKLDSPAADWLPAEGLRRSA
jgi:hypothetical protein